MIEFFIMFLVIGAILGFVIDDAGTASAIIVVGSILWAFAFGPWAILTFIELSLGYAFIKKIREGK